MAKSGGKLPNLVGENWDLTDILGPVESDQTLDNLREVIEDVHHFPLLPGSHAPLVRSNSTDYLPMADLPDTKPMNDDDGILPLPNPTLLNVGMPLLNGPSSPAPLIPVPNVAPFGSLPLPPVSDAAVFASLPLPPLPPIPVELARTANNHKRKRRQEIQEEGEEKQSKQRRIRKTYHPITIGEYEGLGCISDLTVNRRLIKLRTKQPNLPAKLSRTMLDKLSPETKKQIYLGLIDIAMAALLHVGEWNEGVYAALFQTLPQDLKAVFFDKMPKELKKDFLLKLDRSATASPLAIIQPATDSSDSSFSDSAVLPANSNIGLLSSTVVPNTLNSGQSSSASAAAMARPVSPSTEVLNSTSSARILQALTARVNPTASVNAAPSAPLPVAVAQQRALDLAIGFFNPNSNSSGSLAGFNADAETYAGLGLAGTDLSSPPLSPVKG